MSSQGAKSGRSLLVAFLGFAAGATVANIYYSQPLLHAISTHFHSSAALTSIISVATQLGYGSGLLVFVPLGDSVERRTLIVGSIIGTALILLSTAFSATLPFLILVSYLLGLICITPQLIVPYAAGIAEPKARGRTRWNRHERSSHRYPLFAVCKRVHRRTGRMAGSLFHRCRWDAAARAYVGAGAACAEAGAAHSLSRVTRFALAHFEPATCRSTPCDHWSPWLRRVQRVLDHIGLLSR